MAEITQPKSRDRFKSIDRTDDQNNRLASTNLHFFVLADAIDELHPNPSREKSLALTALEEAHFWIRKAITLGG